MGIPNDSVTENEIAEKRRQEAEEERKAARRRSLEKSLDEGLEDSFPGLRPDQCHPAAAKRLRQGAKAVADRKLSCVMPRRHDAQTRNR